MIKLNDKVNINVYRISPTRRKCLLRVSDSKEFEIISCPIIGINAAYSGGPLLYMFEIPDDMYGWKIGNWHIKYAGVPEKYLGAIFNELSECYLNWKPEIEDDELEEIKPSSKKPKSIKPESVKPVSIKIPSVKSENLPPVSEKIPNTVRVV